MASIPDNRRRLADLMERRRVELGLRWKEVAEAGGISYEAIRAVRNGEADIRALTKHGIDVGLRWAPGSVQSILEGGDPKTTDSAASAPPPLAAVPDTPADGNDATVFDLVLHSLTDDLERMVWQTRSQSIAKRIATINDLRARQAELIAGLEAETNGGGKSSGTALTVAGI